MLGKFAELVRRHLFGLPRLRVRWVRQAKVAVVGTSLGDLNVGRRFEPPPTLGAVHRDVWLRPIADRYQAADSFAELRKVDVNRIRQEGFGVVEEPGHVGSAQDTAGSKMIDRFALILPKHEAPAKPRIQELRVHGLGGSVRESPEIAFVHPLCGGAKQDLVWRFAFDLDSDSLGDNVVFSLQEVVQRDAS